MTKNILFITDIPEDTGSFIGRYYPLAYELSQLNYNITILMPRHDEKDYIVNDNFKIKCIGKPLFKKLENSRSYYSTSKTIMIMIKYIYNYLKFYLLNKVDILYLGKPLPASGLSSILIKPFVKKLIIDCDDLETVTNNISNGLQFKVLSFFEKNLPKFANKITTHTSYLYNQLKLSGVNENNIITLPNGIDTNRFTLDSTNSSQKTYFTILYFGDINLDSGHSVDIIIKSLEYLKDMDIKFKLIILGDGKDFEKLKDLAININVNSYIEWKGRVDPKDINQFLISSDVTIDPVSKHLGNLSRFPLKIIESAYCQIPVITSDYGDRKSILKDSGIYVEIDNPKDMAKKIFKLSNESEKDKIYRQNRLSEIAQQYTWKNLTQEFIKQI